MLYLSNMNTISTEAIDIVIKVFLVVFLGRKPFTPKNRPTLNLYRFSRKLLYSVTKKEKGSKLFFFWGGGLCSLSRA